MITRHALSALLLYACVCPAAWADPAPLAGAPAPEASAPEASPAGRSGGTRGASQGDAQGQAVSVPAAELSRPAPKSDRTGTVRPPADGGRPADTHASAGSLSRNLLVALQILRQRFQ